MLIGRRLVVLAVRAAFLLGLHGMDAGAQALRTPSLAPANTDSQFRDMIGKVFPQAEIKNKGERGDEGSYRFKDFDAVNGYARVIGPFGGYDDFFLLRGERRDYLLSIEYSCGPACAQRATAHRFDAGAAPVSMPVKDILDLSQFGQIYRRLVSGCLDSDGEFNTEKDARDAAHRPMPPCPYVFSFPKKGSGAILFKVLNENGSDLLLIIGKSKVSPRVLLRWNGMKLVGFEPGNEDEIILNSSEMGRFF